MLKFTIRKNSIQINIPVKRHLTLEDRIKLVGVLWQLLEKGGTIAESDEVTVTQIPKKPKSSSKAEEILEEPREYILCTFCNTKNSLGSERCSGCQGSLKLVGREGRDG